MGETSEKSIVINDLLSFLTCKTKLVPKERLLSCISEYYSEDAISEAQKMLLAALPVKKSTRHGRRVKHPDTLVAIYDCIQLIPKDDLPIFVCKDLNNVPNLNVMKLENREREDNCKKNFKNEEFGKVIEMGNKEEEMDEALCRKEQKLMRSQISEMFSIITELKVGLQKFTENRKQFSKDEIVDAKNERDAIHTNLHNSLKPKHVSLSPSISSSSSSVEDFQIMERDDLESEENSKLDGLALIQKLIDEDDENNKLDLLEKEDNPYDFDDDPDYMDEFDDIENYEDQNQSMEEEESSNNNEFDLTKSKPSVTTTKTVNLCSKKPGVVVTPSQNGQKVIYIKNEFGDDLHMNESNADLPTLNSEIENSIEITTSSDFIGQIDEMEETTHSSHRVPPLYGGEDLSPSSEVKNEEVHTDESEANQKKRGNSYQCHYCMELFTAHKKLRKHMSTHCIVKNSYYCVLCHLKFMNKDELREHFASCFEKSKEKYKKNICNVCKTFYASDKALKQHKNLHEEFRPHSCPHCPFKYLNKTTLDAHVKNQHSPLNKFICPFCSHSAITNAYLSKHIKVHTGEAPFECKTCGHKAKTKFLLKRHIELHGPLRERKCDKCSFVCVGLNEYLRHRRKQHGKPIVCQICKQSFKQSSTFVRHYNLHTQKKPYKCDRCLYRATVKETLRLHKLTHTGPNVQLCPECGVPCRNKRNLRRHLELYCNNLEKSIND